MIGVCIRYFNKNYGGMLQAYATIKFLEENGYDYELIRYKKKKSIGLILKSVPRILNKILINDKKEQFKKKLGKMFHSEFKKNDQIRAVAFERFISNSFTKLSPINIGYKELKNNSKKYDVVLTGSDQLWSPAGLPTNFYNLMFCAEKVKRVSYASSFGVSYIPWYQKNRTKKYLNMMDCISVREHSGAKIISNLTGKNVPVVLDPVMLHTKEKWDNLIPSKNMVNEKYVFAYFLGKNKTYRDEVENFAKNKGLKVVTLKYLDQYVKADENFGDISLYDVAPDDFLNLIRFAEYIFTDSFHGSVFSIIYHKKFMTFNRYSNKSKVSKNSRIDTLMKTTGLNRRFNDNIDLVCDEINYENVDDILTKYRNSSIEYLINALEVNND